ARAVSGSAIENLKEKCPESAKPPAPRRLCAATSEQGAPSPPPSAPPTWFRYPASRRSKSHPDPVAAPHALPAQSSACPFPARSVPPEISGWDAETPPDLRS